jgi:hypothetical protein
VAADRQQWLGRFGGDAPPPDHRPIPPHRGRDVPQSPKRQPGDGEQRRRLSAPRACGYAYRKYLGACDGSAYLGAEAAAHQQRVGVWAVPGGIQRAWDWRKGTRGPGQAAAPSAAPSAPAGGYSGQKLTCRQIGSYARAQELLRQGHTYLDTNGDGVACESLR